MVRQARLGSRAAAAAGSRACSTSSPVATTRGAAARSAARSATISCAHPDSTSCWASAVRAKPPSSSAQRGQRRPQHEHVAGVRVGRARFVVEVVAVVPDGQQAEVGDRRVGRGAGADDRADRAALDRQPPPVALGRPEVGRQRDVRARAERGGDGGVEAGEVAGVGDDRDRASPGRRPRSGSPRPAGPASPRPAAPTTPRAPARPSPTAARNAAPGAVAAEAVRSAARPVGAARVERGGSRRARAATARRAARRRRSCRPTGRRPRGTARRSRRSAPARRRPRARCRPACRRGRCRRAARARRRRPAGRRSAPAPASPACTSASSVLGHLVVERPVEVRQRDVDEQPGHRVDVSGHPAGLRPSSAHRRRHTAMPTSTPDGFAAPTVVSSRNGGQLQPTTDAETDHCPPALEGDHPAGATTEQPARRINPEERQRRGVRSDPPPRERSELAARIADPPRAQRGRVRRSASADQISPRPAWRAARRGRCAPR